MDWTSCIHDPPHVYAIADALAYAKRAVDRFDFVLNLSDLPDESRAAFETLLRNKGVQLKHKRKGGRGEKGWARSGGTDKDKLLTADQLATLSALNECDLALVQYANRRLRLAVAELGHHIPGLS